MFSAWSATKYCTSYQTLGRCTRLCKPGHCARHMNNNKRRRERQADQRATMRRKINKHSSYFGLFPIRGHHSRYLHFYYMAFVLRSDALPATNALFGEKTGPLVFHIKAGASRWVPCPRTQQANLPACSPQPLLNAEQRSRKAVDTIF